MTTMCMMDAIMTMPDRTSDLSSLDSTGNWHKSSKERDSAKVKKQRMSLEETRNLSRYFEVSG